MEKHRRVDQRTREDEIAFRVGKDRPNNKTYEGKLTIYVDQHMNIIKTWKDYCVTSNYKVVGDYNTFVSKLLNYIKSNQNKF